MSAYTKFADQTRDQVLSVMGTASDLAIGAVSTVSEFVGSVVPKLPSLPLVEKLPTPEELVRTSFAFAQDLLAAQKRYAEGLLEAITPITSKVIPNGKPKSSSKTSTKA
jgi:hypothetical protein